MTRADQTNGLLESIYGDLPEMPRHEPVLRTDTHRVMVGCNGDTCRQGRAECRSGCNVVPLKVPRIQVDAPRRSAADVYRDADAQFASRMWRRGRAIREALVFIISVIAFCTLIGWAPKVFAADAETAATVAAGADTATTVIAVGSGIGAEGNALMAHPVAFAALSAGKLLAPRLTRGMEPEARRTVLRSWTALWGAAAVNNLAVLAGIGCPPCIGIAAGVALWVHEGNRRDPEPISAPESEAQLAMVGSPEVMP